MVSRYMKSDIIATNEHNFRRRITPHCIYHRGHLFSSFDRFLPLLLFGLVFDSPYVCLSGLIGECLIDVDGVWGGTRGGMKMEVEVVGGGRT